MGNRRVSSWLNSPIPGPPGCRGAIRRWDQDLYDTDARVYKTEADWPFEARGQTQGIGHRTRGSAILAELKNIVRARPNSGALTSSHPLRHLLMRWSQEFGALTSSHPLRHLVMRWSLGVVLFWFAAQQLYDPGDWTHFVPAFLADAGLPERALIRLHGLLLLCSAAGLLAGTAVRQAAGLAAFILLQIIVALAVEGGEGNVIARDVGLLGLALALVFDPTQASARELPGILDSLAPFRLPLANQPIVVAHERSSEVDFQPAAAAHNGHHPESSPNAGWSVGWPERKVRRR
jgi:uncharacterized membrane protein YphA (DoxX/SURF4 family)